MTTTNLRPEIPTSVQPTSTAVAPESGGLRRNRRRVLLGAGATLVAVAAVGTGVVLGQRATTTTGPAVGTPVTFPSDWQTYRAGERASTTTAPNLGTAVTFSRDWQTYRAGER